MLNLSWLCCVMQGNSVKFVMSVSASNEEVSKLRAQLQQSLMSKKMSDEMCHGLQVNNLNTSQSHQAVYKLLAVLVFVKTTDSYCT